MKLKAGDTCDVTYRNVKILAARDNVAFGLSRNAGALTFRLPECEVTNIRRGEPDGEAVVGPAEV